MPVDSCRSFSVNVSSLAPPSNVISNGINLIRRQPAGTWLPLQVMREGKAVEVVVRFPREAR